MSLLGLPFSFVLCCMTFFRLRLQFLMLVSNAEGECLLQLLLLIIFFFKTIVQREGTEKENFKLKLYVLTTFYYGCRSSFNDSVILLK